MSYMIETFLLCNGGPHGGASVECDGNFGIHDKYLGRKAATLRACAAKQGWTNKRGDDFCPACSKLIAEKTK